MKKIGILCLIIGCFLLLSPVLATFGSDGGENESIENTGKSKEITHSAEDSKEETDEIEIQNQNDNRESDNDSGAEIENTDYFRVFIKDRNEVVTLSALDYISGVVAAEMPAVYNEEALKAQAVVSYTYACYIREHARADRDTAIMGADLSDQSSEYQAYRDRESLQKLWGDDFDFYYGKIRSAVGEVIGKMIVYDDEPIMAAFHAMSWGRTEDCKNVWGGNISYLTSVDSHEDSTSSSFISTCSFTKEQFKSALSIDSDSITIGEIVRTPAGMVDYVLINGKSYSGIKLRSIFSLPSPCFTLSEMNGYYIFTTKGRGHGVGLSQYGANQLALEGYDYEGIILHYYSGVKIV